MNNDYCLQSYRNKYQGEGAGAKASAGGGAGAGAELARELARPIGIRKHEFIK